MTSEGLRVLVVDDDEVLLRSLQRVLVRAGHQVIARTSVHAAREVLDSQSFDVVISDYWMEDGTGEEVARGVRQAQPSTRVLLLSGDREFEVPGFEVLHKPIRPTDLLEALRRN